MAGVEGEEGGRLAPCFLVFPAFGRDVWLVLWWWCISFIYLLTQGIMTAAVLF